VSPAVSGRRPHPLSRRHARRPAPGPSAVLATAERDTVGAIRRSARSLTPDRPTAASLERTIRPSSMHWSTPRRALRDPRSFRAVAQPR
jgi:hypothetical protein